MSMRQAVAARLLASAQDESAIESGSLDELGADLRALGIDPSRSIALARQQAVMAVTPAGLRDGTLDPGASGAGGMAAVPADHAQAEASRRRRYDWLSPAAVVGLLRVADGVIVMLAAVAAGFTRLLGTKMDLSTEAYATVLAVLLTMHVFQFAGLYSFDRLGNLFDQLGRLLLSWAGVMLSLLALGFMTKMTKELGDTSRLWVGLWFVYGAFGLFTVRLLFKQQIESWQRSGRLTRSVVVVGADTQLIEHLKRHGDRAVRLIGVFDDRHRRLPARIGGVPVRGSVDDLLEFGRTNQIDQIIVAPASGAESRRLSWISKLHALPVDVLACPDMISLQLPYRQVAQIAGVPMLRVFDKPLTGWKYIVKSAEDRVLATAILVLLLPVVLVIAALIKLGSHGPVLLKQKRYGFNNEVIEVYRFRTMSIDRCEDGRMVRATGTLRLAASCAVPPLTSCRS